MYLNIGKQFLQTKLEEQKYFLFYNRNLLYFQISTMFFKVLWLLIATPTILSLDVYFVRHGARAPLQAPMQDIFGAGPEQLTDPGKSQSYYYGQQLRRRHPNITSDLLTVYSTDTNRTKMTAEYFLKGWFGINKKGSRWVEIMPKYKPPSYIGFVPKHKYVFANEFEYAKQILPVPQFEDKTGRTYRKTCYNDEKCQQLLQQKIENNTQICDKFQKFSAGSCKNASVANYFLLKDITRCLKYIGISVPNVTQDQMQLLTEVVNQDYDFQFKQYQFPTRQVQQDFYLVQKSYQKDPSQVIVEFTHDTQMFHDLRALLGIQQLHKMFNGKIEMDFLSSIHFKLQDGKAKLYFNDKQFYLPGCNYKTCSIQQLFKIMNS